MLLASAYRDPIAVTTETLTALPTLTLAKRTELGLTPAQAAAQITIASETYLRLEAGTSKPTWATIMDVLTWLTPDAMP